MERIRRKPHAIIFPLPYQGHINPSVNLALKLASRGFTITFVNYEFIHQKLIQTHYQSMNEDQVDFFSEARKSGLDIRQKTISDGFSPDFDRDNFTVLWESFLSDFPARMEECIGDIVRGADKSLVSCLIADTFFPCAADVAKKYNLVHVSFWTQPALVLTIGYHLDLLSEKGHFPCPDNTEEEIHYLPGVESISTKDLKPYLKQAEKGTIGYRFGTTAYRELKKADIILQNTVKELEPNTLKAFNYIKPTYAIGPISPFTDPPKVVVPMSLCSESDCTEWLDSKPPGSVLYVALGSIAPIIKEEIEELAHGLRLSHVNFIWVVRSNLVKSDPIENILPYGFEDEVKDKGLIVPWCNQIMVLSHPAIGGFLTHCGFNSTLESIWCGVPMICYPLSFDQPIVRKLIVDDWRVGIDLCEGHSICKEEVVQKIQRLMSGTSSVDLRVQANKMKNILRDALKISGSSERNFVQFIKDLESKICSANGYA